MHTLVIAIAIGSAGDVRGAAISEKKSLTLDGAKRVVAAASAEAHKNRAAGVIAVVDDGGNLMCLERLDNTFAAGANISIGKARTAALFKKPTRAFEDIIKGGRTPMVALNDFTPLQGGVPITVDGQIVGAVGVSGANSAQQDEEIALAGAAALSGSMADMPPAAPEAVTYFAKDQVDAAFAVGAVLFDGAGRNYMIHASRRDKPGQAEVHTRETDIVYVQSGSATFVTGGTVVDGKPTGADEIRGGSIRDGQTRTLSPGDVVIVPAGTPHWFKEVRGPLTYYVVKVRSDKLDAPAQQARRLVNVDANGLAVMGYDPVAYFKAGKPAVGLPEYETKVEGATYRFASAENKALFDREPSRYEPQFGGYCAYGAAVNVLAPISVEFFEIVNGRLLLQHNQEAWDLWHKDPEANLKQADANWPGLVETNVR